MSTRKLYTDSSDLAGAIADLSTVVTGLSGAGTSSQAAATAVDFTTYQRFTTVALNSGARLPIAAPGARIVICNMGANPLLVYPATGETIGNGAANASLSVAVGKACEFFCVATGGWCNILSA